MLRQIFYRFAALVVLLVAPAAVHGQEPKPVRIRAAALADGSSSDLVLAWRYHAGDDPRWADPAFEDAGWELVEPVMSRFGQRPREGWQGIGWFRRHLRIEPALQGKPLVIRVETPGATAVFLDGTLLMSVPAPGLRAGGKDGGWREVVFSPGRDHVLAVRHALPSADWRAQSGDPGFRLSIERTDAAALRSAAERLSTTLLAVFTAVPAFLIVLHLALYLSYPKARENLFYALTMAAFAAIVVFDLGLSRSTSEFWSVLAARLIISSVLLTVFFFLLTYYAVRTRTFPRTWIAFAAIGAGLVSWILLSPDFPSQWVWFVYFGLLIVEVIRVEATAEKVHREGVRILLRGFAVMAIVILLQILMQLGLIPQVGSMGGRPYLFGLLAVAVAMSLFLAQSFARTSRHLERRLDEVSALSEQVLAQERAAHEQELRRRLLEAENARKTSEIEAARTLQLSMLPATLPAVEGLETAAAMLTASEVGGDYYDFRTAPDGSLVVAFGDATGHGVAAGIMVTAIKALFSTLGGAESLPSVLAECGRVLREMYLKPHMCLTLARLTSRSLTICSAAMPPVLIHRAGSGKIEELGAGGPPIGSRLSGVWNEQRVPLAPGDTLLFASDGFAEQLDTTDQPLGYERLSEIFRASAGVPTAELLERLLARVAAWRGEREQGDDITLVAIRVTS